MPNKLLVGKCYIETVPFRMPTYRDEMVQHSNEILDSIKSIIQQRHISKELKNELNDLAKRDAGLMKSLMEFLDMLIPIVIKTHTDKSNNQSEWIGIFATKYQIDRTEVEPLRKLLDGRFGLCHLVALYEYAEDKTSEEIMQNIGIEYKHDITQNDKTALSEMHENRLIPTGALNLALRRLAIRFLWNRGTLHVPLPVDKPLFEVLNNKPLWTSFGEENTFDFAKALKDHFPQTLHVKHTKTISEYLATLLKPRVSFCNV